jgi:TRAP-type C4-dicarboxylate transport system permease small subunit
MIALFNKILFALTKYVAWVGMLFLLGAVVITTSDVVMRTAGGQGIYGAIDLIQLMVMTAAYLSIPYAFMNRSHVAVSVFTERFNRRASALTEMLGAALASAFMCAIAYYGYLQALQQIEYGDLSMIFGLPMIYYWTPLVLGSFLSCVVTVHIFAEHLYTFLTGRSALAEGS